MNELDKDYSEIEGKKLVAETCNGLENWKVMNIEYDIGITIVDEDNRPVICLTKMEDDLYYNDRFRFMLEVIGTDNFVFDDIIKIASQRFFAEVGCKNLTADDCPFSR